MPCATARDYDPEDDEPEHEPTPLEFDVGLVGPEYLFYLRQARVDAGLKELGIP